MNLKDLSLLLPSLSSKLLVILLVVYTQIVFFIFFINNNIFFYLNYSCKSFKMTYELNNDKKLMNLRGLGLLLSLLLSKSLLILLVICTQIVFFIFFINNNIFFYPNHNYMSLRITLLNNDENLINLGGLGLLLLLLLPKSASSR